MKDLVEYAIAKAAGCEFQVKVDDAYEWTTLLSANRVDFIEKHIEMQCIRIKPTTTYYRVYLDQLTPTGGLVTLESSEPFANPNQNVHDFEREEPLTVTEEITLYEYQNPFGQYPAKFWLRSDKFTFGNVKRTSHTPITGVIKGDES